MRIAILHNTTRGVDLAARCGVADSFWSRLRGLLGQPQLREGQGLLITPCRAVHMMGMKYAIDVVFLDREGRVVGLEPRLEPRAKSAWYPRARHALELPAGTVEATGTRLGDVITIDRLLGGSFPEDVEDVAEGREAISITGAA